MTEKFSNFEDGLVVFCAKRSVPSRRWQKIPRSQVLDIFSPVDVLVYTKDSALANGWWGIAFSVYRKLVDSGRDWLLVLLVRDGEEGYLLSGTQVSGMVTALSTNATEHILHESDASSGFHFRTFEEAYSRILAAAPKQYANY